MVPCSWCDVKRCSLDVVLNLTGVAFYHQSRSKWAKYNDHASTHLCMSSVIEILLHPFLDLAFLITAICTTVDAILLRRRRYQRDLRLPYLKYAQVIASSDNEVTDNRDLRCVRVMRLWKRVDC